MEQYVLELLNSTSFIWLFLGALGAGALTSLAPCSLLAVPLLVGSAIGLSRDIKEEQRVRFTLIFSSLFAFGVVISFSILAYPSRSTSGEVERGNNYLTKQLFLHYNCIYK
ncbi:MAG: hypothetical protein ACOC08_06345 [Campylobacterales bacterium]